MKLWIWCWWYQEHPPKCPPSELYHINLRVARGQTEPIKLCSSGHTPHPSGAGQFLTDRKSLGAGKHQFSNPANSRPPKMMTDTPLETHYPDLMPKHLAKVREEALNGFMVTIQNLRWVLTRGHLCQLWLAQRFRTHMLTVWTLKGGQEELNKVIKGLVSTNNIQRIDSFGAPSNMQVTMVMGAVNQW